jgi:Na+-driven multidrug efflux pump
VLGRDRNPEEIVIGAISKASHLIAWFFAFAQIVVLLSACFRGLNEVSLGLAIVSLVAFFVFLFISSIIDQSRVPVRTRVPHG